jgi:hypothetical protein
MRIAGLSALVLSAVANGQCWVPPAVNVPGPGGDGYTRVWRAIPFDPDGAGPLPPATLASGRFNQAGLVGVSNVALWDGTRWQPSPLPVIEQFDGTAIERTADGRVFALSTMPDAVHVLEDGVWRSITANLVDGPESIINMVLSAMTLQGNLYVGGYLRVGDRNCMLARWNGQTWEPVGQPWDWPIDIRAFRVLGESIYAFGSFNLTNLAGRAAILRLNAQGQWEHVLPDASPTDLAISVVNDGDGVLVCGSLTRVVNGAAQRVRVGQLSASGFEPLLTGFSLTRAVSAVRVDGELIVSTDSISGQQRGQLNRIVNNTLVPITERGFAGPPYFYGTTPQGVLLIGNDVTLPGTPGSVARLVGSVVAPLVEGFAGRVSDHVAWNGQSIVLGEFLNSFGQDMQGPGVRVDGIVRPLIAGLSISAPTTQGTVWDGQLAFAADAIYTWDGATLRNLGSPAPADQIRQLIAWNGQLLALSSLASVLMPGSCDLHVWTSAGWRLLDAQQPRIGRLFTTATELFTASYAPAGSAAGVPARWTGSQWSPLDAEDTTTRLVGTWHDAAVGLSLVSNVERTRLWRNGAWTNLPGADINYYRLPRTDWNGDTRFGSQLVIAGLSNDSTFLFANFNGVGWQTWIRPLEQTSPNTLAVAGSTDTEGLSFGNVVNLAGPRPSIFEAPVSQTVPYGGTVTFRVETDTGATVTWRSGSSFENLIDGPQADGSTVQGATTNQLTIRNVAYSSAKTYIARVSLTRPFAPCPTTTETTVTLTVVPAPCDSADFNNNDVFPEDEDMVDFFNVLAGAECPICNDIDFNNNGVFPEDQDVIDFFNVLAGGTCP